MSQTREVSNEVMIIPCKSKESSNISKISRNWPVSDSLEFDRVHCDVSRFQDESEIVHLFLFKVAFFRFEE